MIRIKILIDNNPVFYIRDNTFTTGKIGLWSGSCQNAYFDNVKVYGDTAISTEIIGDVVPADNVMAAAPLQVFWGDLHSHSNLSTDAASVGAVSPAELYALARDTYHLDFLAITDHDFSFVLPGTDWNVIKPIAAAYDSPGIFAAIAGYEWTDSLYNSTQPPYFWEHIPVYFEGNEGNLYSAADQNYDSPSKLITALQQDQHPFMAHRAHPGRENGYSTYDTWAYSTTLDSFIANAEGFSSGDRTSGVWDGWNAGHHLGVIGCSDSHQMLLERILPAFLPQGSTVQLFLMLCGTGTLLQ